MKAAAVSRSVLALLGAPVLLGVSAIFLGAGEAWFVVLTGGLIFAVLLASTLHVLRRRIRPSFGSVVGISAALAVGLVLTLRAGSALMLLPWKPKMEMQIAVLLTVVYALQAAMAGAVLGVAYWVLAYMGAGPSAKAERN